MHQNCEDKPHLQGNRARKSPFCVEASSDAIDAKVSSPFVYGTNVVEFPGGKILLTTTDDTSTYFISDTIEFYDGMDLIYSYRFKGEDNWYGRLVVFVLAAYRIFYSDRAFTLLEIAAKIQQDFHNTPQFELARYPVTQGVKTEFMNLMEYPPSFLRRIDATPDSAARFWIKPPINPLAFVTPLSHIHAYPKSLEKEPTPIKADDEPIVLCPLVTAENEVWLGSHCVVFALCADGNHYTDDDIEFFKGVQPVSTLHLLDQYNLNLETRMALFILTSGQIYTPEKALTSLQLIEAVGHYFSIWTDTQQCALDCFKHLRLDLAKLVASKPGWLGTTVNPISADTQLSEFNRTRFYFKPSNGDMSLTTYPVEVVEPIEPIETIDDSAGVVKEKVEVNRRLKVDKFKVNLLLVQLLAHHYYFEGADDREFYATHPCGTVEADSGRFPLTLQAAYNIAVSAGYLFRDDPSDCNEVPDPTGDAEDYTHIISEKGRVYVKGLLAVPAPVKVIAWKIPRR